MATQVELYRFTEQDSDDVWTYTSSDVRVTYNSEDYLPISITRSGTEIKNDLAKADLTITLPLTNEMAMRWMKDNGELLVGLTIFTKNKAGVTNVTWKGRLASVVPGMANVQLKFESIFTSMRRPGLRARYQRSCRHALYGRGCLVDPDDYALTSAVTAVTGGRTLTCTAASSHPTGYFVGGMLRSPDGVLSYIVDHVGTAITIQRMSYSLQQSIDAGFPFDVILYPGCDHSRATCIAKFDNLLNYGGYDFIPQKNPTGGSSIV